MSKVTPMLAQFLSIKELYPDCILFYRVGDFYEMFYQDALDASAILDITLTKKRLGTDIEPAPLCGVPYHAAESYLARLLAAGRRVAICDQVEDPALAKGLVKRDVTRVLTPGTLTSELMLEPGGNNYLASVCYDNPGGGIGLAYADITTGEFEAMGFESDTAAARERALLHELGRVGPAEIVLSVAPADGEETEEAARDIADTLTAKTGAPVRILPPSAENAIPSEEYSVMDAAVSGLFAYLKAVKALEMPSLDGISVHKTSERMLVDRTAARNLELVLSMFDKGREGTLLRVLDKTRTAMGARMLKRWISEPLLRKDDIDARLEAVDFLLNAYLTRNDIREALRRVSDLERLAGRIEAGTANGRDLIGLKNSLILLPELKSLSIDAGAPLLRELADSIRDHSEIHGRIEAALLEEQPLSTLGGGVIRDGFSPELDKMKLGISDGKNWIASLENEERERTGIKSLKVRYNRVQGYYIEITNSNLDQIPDDYIRKQTLTGGERFITPELKRMENIVLSAEAGINAFEAELFEGLRLEVRAHLASIREAASAVSKLDVLASLAQTAQENGYKRPVITDGDRILIVRGRHPVLEHISFASGGSFVPNDVNLDLEGQSMLLITGPNMAGKSTYMRQTALIVLMAQMGSFVPADSAEIGICDRIFTRIGASDNIAREQSTFLVEMNELSEIIDEYTDKSLIILDEIGRGTSTYDGLAIAWAAADYLCAEGRRARTMFATHYHELTALEGVLPGLVNLSTMIDDTGGDVTYLHKVVAGAMGRSYGIHVAKMAGLPEELIYDANMKLEALEKESKEIRIADPEALDRQMSFLNFNNEKENDGDLNAFARTIREELENIDVLELTPSAAIALIEKLKESVRQPEKG